MTTIVIVSEFFETMMWHNGKLSSKMIHIICIVSCNFRTYNVWPFSTTVSKNSDTMNHSQCIIKRENRVISWWTMWIHKISRWTSCKLLLFIYLNEMTIFTCYVWTFIRKKPIWYFVVRQTYSFVSGQIQGLKYE